MSVAREKIDGFTLLDLAFGTVLLFLVFVPLAYLLERYFFDIRALEKHVEKHAEEQNRNLEQLNLGSCSGRVFLSCSLFRSTRAEHTERLIIYNTEG